MQEKQKKASSITERIEGVAIDYYTFFLYILYLFSPDMRIILFSYTILTRHERLLAYNILSVHKNPFYVNIGVFILKIYFFNIYLYIHYILIHFNITKLSPNTILSLPQYHTRTISKNTYLIINIT